MSIAAKVTLVVSIIAALLLAAGGYLALILKEQERIELVNTQAKVLAQVVTLSAESALRNYGQLGALEHLVSRNTEAAITFYDRRGRAVAPVPTEELPVVNNRVLRTMERNEPEQEIAGNALAYRVPLKHNGKVAGAMELRMDLDRATSGGLGGGDLLIGLCLLFAFALVVWLFAWKSIGRPIDQLMDGMDHVIRGDLTVVIPLDRNDEIGRIAYRFNEMTAQLRDAQEEILSSGEARLQLEKRLRQSEKLATIGQLAAEIAHEVGTPLNVIGGRARNLARKAEQPAEVIKNSRIIADQTDRITKIIQQMLDLSRARIPLRSRIQLTQIIGDALAFLEYQIETSSISVGFQPDPDLPEVTGDPDGLQQVFINLLLNAIQAMPAGGTLTITATLERRRKEGLDLAPPQPFVVVRIADTGPGISQLVQDQIFEPFYSTKRQGEGTGLGLTVVHGIVKEHDGWVEVRNREPHGTQFSVYLPHEREELAAPAESMEPDEPAEPPRSADPTTTPQMAERR